jgi:DNA-binding LytR/AlgR family response regulator
MDPAGNSKVLIVEDDPLFMESMRALLSGAGYSVTSALSSTDPNLERWFADNDLVVLDLNLPERNGFELLHSIRETPETADKPVLMLTAHDPMKYRLKGLALGADDYVVKPPNREELLLRVAGLLRRAGCAHPSRAEDPRIVVDNPGGGRGFVYASDVSHICAARNYCYVHTRDERKLTSFSISQLAEQLGDTFVRAHRSYLVNPAFVQSARWLNSSAYVLDMDSSDNVQVPVSRAYRNDVRQALGLSDRALATAG